MNVMGILRYDGSAFLGWQDIKTGPSVESTITNALKRLLYQDIRVQGASRTDRGVHASGQVVQFHLSTKHDLHKLKQSLNHRLPRSMNLLSLAEAKSTFHPSLDATSKCYTYTIDLNPVQSPFERTSVWHYPRKLNLTEMKKAALHLTGKRDFKAFENVSFLPRTDTVCTVENISISITNNNHLIFEVTGNRFLYKMVRNIVGTLVFVGKNKLTASVMPDLLKKKDRRLIGITAPAHGLCLTKVLY